MAHSVRINIPSLVNTRDLGGLVNIDGKKIKPHSILRSGTLYNIPDKDIKLLFDNYNLRTIIDLRSVTEVSQKPDNVIKGIKYIENPILTDTQMGITHEEKQDKERSLYIFIKRVLDNDNAIDFMKDLYINFITNPFCIKQYNSFLNLIAENKTGAVLYHCSVGKDRVGVGTYYILKILGIPDKDIIEDFMLTNYFVEDDVVKNISNLSKEINDVRLEETYRSLFQVQKDYIEALIGYIDNNYGSFENYRKQVLKISDATAETIKDNYLV